MNPSSLSAEVRVEHGGGTRQRSFIPPQPNSQEDAGERDPGRAAPGLSVPGTSSHQTRATAPSRRLVVQPLPWREMNVLGQGRLLAC